MLWSPTVATTVSVECVRKMSPIPQTAKVRISSAKRALTTKDPALERIACSMRRVPLVTGRDRLTRPRAGVIVGLDDSDAARGSQHGGSDTADRRQLEDERHARGRDGAGPRPGPSHGRGRE